LTTGGGSTSIAATCGPPCGASRRSVGGAAMTWETPEFVEVKMDAEINSYQDDVGGEQDDRF